MNGFVSWKLFIVVLVWLTTLLFSVGSYAMRQSEKLQETKYGYLVEKVNAIYIEVKEIKKGLFKFNP
jgi:hypothetical protein